MRPDVPQIVGGRAFVGGLAASALADEHGTPLFVLDAAAIRDGLEALRRAVKHPRTTIFYSVKANPSIAVLRLLRATGVRLDACSPGDLAFAAAAGFEPVEISYTGHAMSGAEVERVVRSGVQFTADSLSQLERFGALAPGRDVGLRINAGIDAGFHTDVRASASGSKFGVHRSQLPDALELCAQAGLRLVGLHGHVGSHLADHHPHEELLRRLLDLGSAIESLAWVNLGGGWSEPEYDLAAFGRAVSERLAAAEAAAGRTLELRLEPGAQLVIDAGCLITRVTEVKSSVDLGQAESPAFVGTDTSSNHLPSAMAYGTAHPIVVAERADGIADGRYDIVGNLMLAADVLGRNRPLPAPGPGDVLVIGRAGGYAAWRGTNFNERPRPAEVLVDGELSTLIRRAETDADLLRLEVDRVAGMTADGAAPADGRIPIRKATSSFASAFGMFELIAYELPGGGEHLMLVAGDPGSSESPLVRVQSSCLTGTALHALLCDCRQQLHDSLERIADEGEGCLLYLDQEGRGHGLVEKVEHLAQISAGFDTVDAALQRGVAPDVREYSAVATMLRDVLGGLPPIRLLTNNPSKIEGIEAAGVPIASRVPIESEPTPENIGYLRIKKERMGHLLTGV